MKNLHAILPNLFLICALPHAGAAVVMWDASSGLLPDQASPPWILDSTSPNQPVLTNNALLITTSASAEHLAYVMTGPILAGITNLEMTVNMRVVSGSLYGDFRGPATIGITMAPDVGVNLWMGDDGITLNSAPDTPGPKASVDTTNAFHTYTIQVSGTNVGSAVKVYYDGAQVLGGRTYAAHPGHFYSEPSVHWGDGTAWTSGVSEWRLVTVNDTLSNLLVLSIYTAVEICYPTEANKLYQLQFTTNLFGTNWMDFGAPVVGTGLTNCTFDSTRYSVKRYYRVIVLQ